MATAPTKVIVTGLTAARMKNIEAASVTSGKVDAAGNLTLTTRGGDVIQAGNIKGPTGGTGPAGGVNKVNGLQGDVTLPTTSTAAAGLIEQATLAEALVGADPFRGISPAVLKQVLDLFVPVGSVIMFASTAAISGWLQCDGRAVDRAAYPDLFAKIGTRYGSGNGTSTFNVPNLKGRVVIGVDPNQSPINSPGEVVGANSHTHPLSDAGQAMISQQQVDGRWINSRRVPVSESRKATHSFDAPGSVTQIEAIAMATGTALGGDTDAGSSLQPSLALYYLIRT